MNDKRHTQAPTAYKHQPCFCLKHPRLNVRIGLLWNPGMGNYIACPACNLTGALLLPVMEGQ